MKSRTPEQAGCELLGALAPLGRVVRFELADGRELWRLPADDPARASLRWGMARGVGCFEAAGQDSLGIWFVRELQRGSFVAWLDSAPELPSALTVFAGIARLLDVCERQNVFPGPLLPETLNVDAQSLQPSLTADLWLAELVTGERSELAVEGHHLRFLPPAQASGEPWDAAANRYVFGLLLYEVLAGEAPFVGQGMRLSLEERTQRAPVTFPDERRERLPPGLQSFCLRLLHPEAEQRPSSAAAIVAELRRFTHGDHAPEDAATSEANQATSGVLADLAAPGSRRLPLALLSLLAAVLLSVLVIASRGQAPGRATLGERAPLRASASANDCASCHPRHTSEWRSSVMAHAATSPLFLALEQLITEQVGRSDDCPQGAGVLRHAGANACRDRDTGLPLTGSGGEGWCSNCHMPSVKLTQVPAAFRALETRSLTHAPLSELVSPVATEGIGCAVCHQAVAPLGLGGRGSEEGNSFWTSAETGRRFEFRPGAAGEARGIANSGYRLEPQSFLPGVAEQQELVAGGAHRRVVQHVRSYQRSSEFCGTCHDVRLFGTDVLGKPGQNFKRLRNAYSEWSSWAQSERRRGVEPASCVDCHMSSYPGVCIPDEASSGDRRGCPPGTRFSARTPGALPEGRTAANSEATSAQHPHYFSGVDLPLDPRFIAAPAEDALLDSAGIPLGPRARRDLLLASSLRLELERVQLRGGQLSVPLRIENVGAGHRVPAGFSQERELWVWLTISDARGRLVYEVGRVERPDQDLRDKVFLRVGTDDARRDARGRPLGLFGADIADGPDAPDWSPAPDLGGSRFRGRGLINFQNGFLRCVKCIGRLTASGECQPLPGQERTRAARFEDGEYDADTGRCSSNLRGRAALLEVFFPVGGLDAERGIVKAPDAIIDTRSLAPGEPVQYVYELDVGRAQGPFRVQARLMFRAFPPYLLRAFTAYERAQAARGLRPSGPLIDERSLTKLEISEVATSELTGPGS